MSLHTCVRFLLVVFMILNNKIEKLFLNYQINVISQLFNLESINFKMNFTSLRGYSLKHMVFQIGVTFDYVTSNLFNLIH
jgi:hypothetical protein